LWTVRSIFIVGLYGSGFSWGRLPRHILNCHEAALRSGYKIPWDLIFADDHSGFAFRDRPMLSKLREEYKKSDRRADAIVIEYLDRLSRNADWHQGFLLDEMKDRKLTVIFWNQFNSRIERAVMGAISQEGMEQAKQRMMEGNLIKAKSGRVTARTAAFGYNLVASDGSTTNLAKKDTHYAICDEQAEIVRFIFDKIGNDGLSLRGMAAWLDERFPPPGKGAYWSPRQVENIIRNPLYKGEFAAHRWDYKQIKAAHQNPFEPEKMVWRKIERPKSEWIVVSVPAIVCPDVWQLANDMLPRNKETAKRNAKLDYLLTGLMQCAECESAFVGKSKSTIRAGKHYISSAYSCTSRVCAVGRAKLATCQQRQINTKVIEAAVWKVVSHVILHPEIVINALEEMYASGANQQLIAEVAYLEKQQGELRAEDERLYRAYNAGAYDEDELAKLRHDIKSRGKKLEEEKAKVKVKIVTHEEIEATKARIISICAHYRPHVENVETPFEMKKVMTRLVVDRIKINTREEWFDLEGVFRGRYDYDGAIVNISAGRGSPSPRA
jgi:site-specific DNA recombinase